jgi:hypothetical protein
MKRLLTCLWVLLCVTTLCVTAQDDKKKSVEKTRPDLSGAWVLDRQKSKFGPSFLRESGSVTLTVSHHEPEIRITRKLSLNGREQIHQLVYYSDGRGETNPHLVGKGTLKTKTVWKGNKLVSKSTARSRTPQGDIEMDLFEKWELSSGGMGLTQTSWSDPPRGNPGPQIFLVVGDQSAVKKVFNRVP